MSSHQIRFERAIGRLIINWALMDEQIIRGIHQLQAAFFHAGKLEITPDMLTKYPGDFKIPFRFEHRAEKQFKLLREHAGKGTLQQLIDQESQRISRVKPLRDDVAHGYLSFAGGDASDPSILIVPSRWKTFMVLHKKYEVKVSDIESAADVLALTADTLWTLQTAVIDLIHASPNPGVIPRWPRREDDPE